MNAESMKLGDNCTSATVRVFLQWVHGLEEPQQLGQVMVLMVRRLPLR
jgi:hypothetical protein